MIQLKNSQSITLTIKVILKFTRTIMTQAVYPQMIKRDMERTRACEKFLVNDSTSAAIRWSLKRVMENEGERERKKERKKERKRERRERRERKMEKVEQREVGDKVITEKTEGI